jgi:hypothetical protein
VVHLVGTGVATKDLVQTVAHLNDRILIRLIELVRTARYPDLTDRFAFLALGSEGRQEQTLSTDQDNAIVYADDLTAAERERLAAFSVDLIDQLIAIGVPPCPAASWQRTRRGGAASASGRRVLDKWLRTPSPENILAGSMFFDLRTLYGDERFEAELKRTSPRSFVPTTCFWPTAPRMRWLQAAAGVIREPEAGEARTAPRQHRAEEGRHLSDHRGRQGDGPAGGRRRRRYAWPRVRTARTPGSCARSRRTT